MNCSSPPFLSSFDPAVHLHSESNQLPDATLPASTFSDDIEALHLQRKETTAAKNDEGIVIQHRAWRALDVFRSEEDHSIDTPLKQRDPQIRKDLAEIGGSSYPPSSPPVTKMPLISSPVTYPPSSSPLQESPRKRRKLDVARVPLQDVPANGSTRLLGGFLEADSDEDEELATIKAAHAKRKLFKVPLSVPTPPDEETIQVEHASRTLADNKGVTAIGVEQDDGVATLEELPSLPLPVQRDHDGATNPLSMMTCSGRTMYVGQRQAKAAVSYEQLIAARSVAAPGRATKSYYGIDIHRLMDDAARETEDAVRIARTSQVDAPQPSVEQPVAPQSKSKNGRTLMWTEKYRAKKFADLIGDERTHRSVLRWLKGWDQIVFPGSSRPRPKNSKSGADAGEERAHKKVLLLTGPPGLGKTTLAHVCARQAGYEVQEINASDERSRDVVKGRIRDMVGTENVKGVDTKTPDGKVRKAGRPVCVVVDEVDGVVSGSGGSGEGGFIKALIDLIHLDQKNSSAIANNTTATGPKRKKRGDKFRLLRPLILICNDVYHSSLRPLRQSSFAEIIHVRKPPLNMVVSRMHSIFEKEDVPSDMDGVRRLCEAIWGVSTRKSSLTGSGTGEGDIRGIMVVGEWVARKLQAAMHAVIPGTVRLTRSWVEEHILNDLAHDGGAARSLGRGGAKEVVDRVFLEGAGFPKSVVPDQEHITSLDSGVITGVAEAGKRRGMERLREMIDTSGECDRIMTDCFTSYPTQPFQDDTLLSKPSAAYDWLHFHDTLSSAVYGSQEWELAPYLLHSVLAFHHLFASPATARHTYGSSTKYNRPDDAAEPTDEPTPFSGPSAPFTAAETQKANRAALHALQSTLSLPLSRIYRSPEDLSTELLPYILRMLHPDVKPVIVNTSTAADKSKGTGGSSSSTASVRKASEKALVARAVNCMAATGVRFERSRVDFESTRPGQSGGWVYRMEPGVDALGVFETMAGRRDERVRYAVRQVLEMEWKRESVRREEEARRRRFSRGGREGEEEDETPASAGGAKEEKKGPVKGVKRDFFGRVIAAARPTSSSSDGGTLDDAGSKKHKTEDGKEQEQERVWVSFNEGYSNAVRKPITLEELMRGF